VESRLDGAEMNRGVFVERKISEMAARTDTSREVVLPAHRAGAPEIGGLELAVARVDRRGLRLTSDQFRIISVRSGSARVSVGQAETQLHEHEHLGIPSDCSAHICQLGDAPLVVLDATLKPLGSSASNERD
jgi:hypothetical protein